MESTRFFFVTHFWTFFVLFLLLGYGFLSENEAFVSLCEKHGVKLLGCRAEGMWQYSPVRLWHPRFVGPSSTIIDLFGDKTKACPAQKQVIKSRIEHTIESRTSRIRTSKICGKERIQYTWFFDQRPALKSVHCTAPVHNVQSESFMIFVVVTMWWLACHPFLWRIWFPGQGGCHQGKDPCFTGKPWTQKCPRSYSLSSGQGSGQLHWRYNILSRCGSIWFVSYPNDFSLDPN